MLDLIRELKPSLAKIAVLGNPSRSDFQRSVDEVLEPARTFGLQVHLLEARTESEITSAFSRLAQERSVALLVLSDPVYLNLRAHIVKLAALHAVPTIHTGRDYVVAGGLMSYEASIGDSYRQAGVYAARILKGAKPADLPVMQPTKFDLVST